MEASKTVRYIGLTLLSGDFGELWYRDIGFAEGRLAGLGIVAFLTRRLAAFIIMY